MNHHIQRESLSTGSRMSDILSLLAKEKSLMFWQLFKFEEGRSGAVVSFLAILQLCKEQLIGIAINNDVPTNNKNDNKMMDNTTTCYKGSELNIFLLTENHPTLSEQGAKNHNE